MEKSLTYADAGVDIDKANKFITVIKKIAKTTVKPGVMGEIGGFGGLFSPNLSQIEKPVLVSSTDGVGTKLKIAFMMDKHNTIGIDLVAMCVNDILVQGSKPLFFLDYLSMGKLKIKTATAVIKGIASGCKEAKCALLGGETAEMPGMYQKGEYDLAGFIVGIVDNNKIIDGSEISVGNKLIGVPSSGLHSNGYSLARHICFDKLKLKIDDFMPEFDKTLGEELLTPTRIYSNLITGVSKGLSINGLAHITGGGMVDNIIRILPKTCKAVMYNASWEIPPVFTFLQDAGNVSDQEMMRTFNNGIGMVAVVPDKICQEVMDKMIAMQEKPFLIGEIAERKLNEEQIKWV